MNFNFYFFCKKYFKDHKLNTAESYNSTYRENFTYITATIGQVTNVIMNLVNILVHFGGSPKKRMPYCFGIALSVILFHIIMTAVDSSSCKMKLFMNY
jgi:hypothetical protein